MADLLQNNAVDKIEEVTPRGASLLEEMYKLYQCLFQAPEETETLESLKRYLFLKETNFYGPNNYHILVAKKLGRIVGFIIGDYYAETSIGFIEFIGVAKDTQRRGVGALLETAFIEKAKEDAHRQGKELKGMIIEVEDIKKGGNKGTVLFWMHLGYKYIPVRYIQPPLSREKRRAENLRLMFKSLDIDQKIDGETLLKAVKDYFRYAMSIENPEETEEFKLLKSQVLGRTLILENPDISIP